MPETPDTGVDARDTIEMFAEELRDLRISAGNPTLAAISGQTGISKSVLSVAFSGKALPTENTVLKLVVLFGGNQKEWRSRRNRLDPRNISGDTGLDASPKARRFSLGQTSLIAVIAAVVAALVTGIAMNSLATGRAPDSRHLTEAANGVDPMLTSCRDDAVIAASEARLNNLVHVQLMYSNDCMAVWGRVTRYDDQTDGNSMTMQVWPLDDPQSERAQSRTDIGLQSLYTPMIIEPDTAARICGQATIMVDGKTEDLGPKLCI